MNYTSLPDHVVSSDTVLADINDTIPNKTIELYCDKDGDPIKYSRDIVTGVCIDGECRLVSIKLYWNVTGRYLGFELPNEEFLSKTEHDPFSSFEYDRLHEILGEDNSPLSSYSLEELVPEKDTFSNTVDAITSATIDAVLDHIVEGAVYTTYTLWHIVYGPTQNEIEKHSIKELDSNLVLKILNSGNMKDQVWVLNKMSADIKINSELQDKLMKLIAGMDVYLAERALNALKTEAIDDEIQLELAKVFATSGFLQKRLILQKYKESKHLSPEVIVLLTHELHQLNGTLTKNVLELFSIHSVENEETVWAVAKLLKNKNKYIANQALSYLENLHDPDKKIEKSITKFKKNNS